MVGHLNILTSEEKFPSDDTIYLFSFFRAVFKFEGNNLNVTATGKDFKDFKSAFTNDDRGFGYIRISVSILDVN